MVVIDGFEPVLYYVGTFVVAEDNYSEIEYPKTCIKS